MNKQYALVLLALVGFSGCAKRNKDKPANRRQKSKTEVFSEVEIPVATNEVINSFLDDDIKEFKIVDDSSAAQVATHATEAPNEFAWLEDDATGDNESFKVVLFDFDAYTVRQDQEAALSHNIAVAKRIFDEAQLFGNEAHLPTVVIEGHACHSAGSRAYNLALSEKRAKVLADRFAAAGVPREHIKIVGRGMEVPAIVDGKAVEGDRAQQGPNRRDELRIFYS